MSTKPSRKRPLAAAATAAQPPALKKQQQQRPPASSASTSVSTSASTSPVLVPAAEPLAPVPPALMPLPGAGADASADAESSPVLVPMPALMPLPLRAPKPALLLLLVFAPGADAELVAYEIKCVKLLPELALAPFLKGAPDLYRNIDFDPAPEEGWRLACDRKYRKAPAVDDPRKVASLGKEDNYVLFWPSRAYPCAVALFDHPTGMRRAVGLGDLEEVPFVAVSPCGMYVAAVEPARRRVVVFRYVAEKAGQRDSSPYVVHARIAGVVCRPQGATFLRDGAHLAVADLETHSVEVFALDGTHVRSLRGSNTLSFPLDVACLHNGDLVVADSGHRRIAVLDATTGELLQSLQTPAAARLTAAGDETFCGLVAGCPVDVPGHELFNAVAVLPDGRVAAHDARSRSTFVFTCQRP